MISIRVGPVGDGGVAAGHIVVGISWRVRCREGLDGREEDVEGRVWSPKAIYQNTSLSPYDSDVFESL